MQKITLEIAFKEPLNDENIEELKRSIFSGWDAEAVHVSKIEEYRESYSIVDEFGQI